MNKPVAILLVIVGLALFFYYLKMELNSDLSKEWFSTISGVLVAVVLALVVFYQQKKNQKQ